MLERLTHGQPGKGIPQSNYPTLRTSGQPLPVRAQVEERKGSFRLDRLANCLAGSDIPDSHWSVIGSTDEAASVRAEFDVQDLIVVGLKLLSLAQLRVSQRVIQPPQVVASMLPSGLKSILVTSVSSFNGGTLVWYVSPVQTPTLPS